MSIGIVTAVYAVLFVFLIIELGLIGYVVNQTSGYGYSSPSPYAFMLFNTIWSLLALVYLAVTPVYFARFYHGLVGFGLLVITTIFWFSGSIAMAAFIGVPHCHGNNFCQCAQAGVAFGFFIWIIFAGLTALEGLATLRGGHAQADKVAHAPA